MNVDKIGIKKIKPLGPDCSVLIKQVFIGLRPIICNPIALVNITKVAITETVTYIFIFFPGFNIPLDLN